MKTQAQLAVFAAAVALAGCDTLDHIQKPPDMSAPGTMAIVPKTNDATQPISAAVPPESEVAPTQPGSLWRPGSKTFFRDPRARTVGDLLTVQVNIQEQGEFQNQANLARNTTNTMSITNLFGIGTLLGHIVPGVKNTSPSISTAGVDQTTGTGDIKRSDSVTVNVATTVVRVLPNHNLEIAGSQEVRLNDELREVQVRGIVRPEDITSSNTITQDKVAEARIAYGGRGISSDVNRPSWGQDVLTRVAPF